MWDNYCKAIFCWAMSLYYYSTWISKYNLADKCLINSRCWGGLQRLTASWVSVIIALIGNVSIYTVLSQNWSHPVSWGR